MKIKTRAKYDLKRSLLLFRYFVKRKVHLFVGKIYDYMVHCSKYRSYCLAAASNLNSGPLTEEAIMEIRLAQESKVGAMIEERVNCRISPSELRRTEMKDLRMQGRVAKLVDHLILKDPEIKSVANIGARIDLASDVLSKLHPQVNFYSIDFQRNLAEHNAMLEPSGNWHFKSGYALDIFESGHFSVDLVFFNGTAFLLNNKEIDALIAAFSNSKVKYIVFNEAYFPEFSWCTLSIIRPEKIPHNRPFISGNSGQYMHNYPAKCREHGYNGMISDLLPRPIFEPLTSPTHNALNYQFVARL